MTTCHLPHPMLCLKCWSAPLAKTQQYTLVPESSTSRRFSIPLVDMLPVAWCHRIKSFQTSRPRHIFRATDLENLATAGVSSFKKTAHSFLFLPKSKYHACQFQNSQWRFFQACQSIVWWKSIHCARNKQIHALLARGDVGAHHIWFEPVWTLRTTGCNKWPFKNPSHCRTCQPNCASNPPQNLVWNLHNLPWNQSPPKP